MDMPNVDALIERTTPEPPVELLIDANEFAEQLLNYSEAQKMLDVHDRGLIPVNDRESINRWMGEREMLSTRVTRAARVLAEAVACAVAFEQAHPAQRAYYP